MTLSLQFKNSLDELMKTLTNSNPYFVRCIKPNDYKRPNDFDEELCIRQLRYTGMQETARIRALGYPIRHTFKEFVHRYRLLGPHLIPQNESFVSYRDLCRRLCASLLKFNPHYQLGQTKVFLKYDQDSFLETEREKAYLRHVLVLQRFTRKVLLILWLRRREQAALTIQKHWRGLCARRLVQRMRDAMERLQARIRARQEAYALEQYNKNVIRIQSLCRGYLARKEYTLRKVRMQKQKYEEEIERQRIEAMKAVRKPILHQQHQPIYAEIRCQNNTTVSEDADRIIDDVFGFLNTSIEDNADLRPKSTTNVSKMILNFEAESRNKKPIPTKLLSRPVNFYSFDSYESRL